MARTQAAGNTATQGSTAQAGGSAEEAITDMGTGAEDTAVTGGAAETQADTSEGTAGQQDTGEAPLPKSDHEKQEAARLFAQRWKGAGEKEIADTQTFWGELLRTVFGVKDLKSIIQFEKPVYGFITLTSVMGTSRILIEQKKKSVDMAREGRQSGGAMLSSYSQAKRYADNLPLDEKPRWIVTCNFATFAVYDMKSTRPEQKPEEVKLADFEREWWRLGFLADPNKEVEKRQEAASRLTGELIGNLHKLMKSKMRSPDDKEALRCLNVFCVRLVFCKGYALLR